MAQIYKTIDNDLRKSLSSDAILAELDFLKAIDLKMRFYDEDVIKKAIYR